MGRIGLSSHSYRPSVALVPWRFHCRLLLCTTIGNGQCTRIFAAFNLGERPLSRRASLGLGILFVRCAVICSSIKLNCKTICAHSPSALCKNLERPTPTILRHLAYNSSTPTCMVHTSILSPPTLWEAEAAAQSVYRHISRHSVALFF